MKTPLTLAAVLTGLAATPALAHPGHIAEEAGHSHWLALIILGGLAAAGAAWGLARLTSRGAHKQDAR